MVIVGPLLHFSEANYHRVWDTKGQRETCMMRRRQARNKRVIAAEIQAELTARFGAVLADEAICTALKYPSMAAFRKALARGTVPVPVFSIEGRRGKFALAADVGDWWATQRNKALSPDSK